MTRRDLNIKEIIELEIKKSRDTKIGAESLEKALGNLQNNQDDQALRKSVRKFHEKFIKNLKNEFEDRYMYSDKTDVMKNWSNIFKNEFGENLSYYRKDSYLLADAPFIFKPVMAFLKPNLVEYEEYYGVDPKGVELLIKNHVMWPEMLHISAYKDKEALKFIGNILKYNIPYYIDAFEDSMATYWINHIVDKKSNAANEYIKNPYKDSFNTFIEKIYRKHFIEKYSKYENILKEIPEEPVIGAPPIVYNNLKKDTLERLMKVSLLSECLDNIAEIKNYGNIEDAISSIGKKLPNMEAVGEFIYKYWHQYGTFWSYSEGNTVDFSARDLYPGGLGKKVDPQKKETSFSIPTLPGFNDIVYNTDIDNKKSINSNAEQRKELLEKFFEKAKKGGYVSPMWMLDFADEFKQMNESKAKGDDLSFSNKKEELEYRIEGIFKTKRIEKKELIEDAAELSMGFLLLAVPVPPLQGVGGLLLTMLGAYKFKSKIDSSRVAHMGVEENAHFYQIPMLPNSTEHSKENSPFMWKMHVVSLPYERSKSQNFSKASVPSMGGDEER